MKFTNYIRMPSFICFILKEAVSHRIMEYVIYRQGLVTTKKLKEWRVHINNVADHLELSEDTVRRYIKPLVKLNFLEKKGDPGNEYYVLTPEKFEKAMSEISIEKLLEMRLETAKARRAKRTKSRNKIRSDNNGKPSAGSNPPPAGSNPPPAGSNRRGSENREPIDHSTRDNITIDPSTKNRPGDADASTDEWIADGVIKNSKLPSVPPQELEELKTKSLRGFEASFGAD